MTKKIPITVAHGDGIGPEIMEAALKIMEAAGAALAPETIEIGEKVYQRGISAGIEDSSWESLNRTKCFLKAPITTPQGGGFKSLNVTVRKSMALFANIRPCISYHPYVKTLQPKMDMVIVRENEEDLYAGIEHQQTDNVVQCLKLISRTGCERIIRYAFEYARANGRQKLTCISKDNIMKMTDGLFSKVFREVAAEYPEFETNHMIVDIGAAKIAAKPSIFDVVVTENLYGDIISDIAAEVSGSVGLCGSSNIGKNGAMFEAIHGSAPDIAGQGIANPSGLLHAALMMLQHIGQGDTAEKIHNAWLKTIEDGIHTGDIFNDQTSKKKVGTRDFCTAVIERLGAKPVHFRAVTYGLPERKQAKIHDVQLPPRADKKLTGVDIFLHWREKANASALAKSLNALAPGNLKLASIDSRGLLVWPEATALQETGDHWRCRFLAADGVALGHENIIALLQQIQASGLDFIKTENLYSFDGVRGYTLVQGQ
ncbi:MAG: NADP-dependent isocitrate dehydrogenase [Alphaproteobacteria bacterium]|nr:NADP-dependent isocitrate dehydrogenase [Alphaproteobacteria bacterium]